MSYGDHYEDEQNEQAPSNLIAAGEHVARCTFWQLGLSTQKETPQIGCTFRIEDGPDDGRIISHTMSFTGGATELTFKAMSAMGWDGQDLREPQGLDANQVRIVVAHETFSDQRTGEPRTVAKVQFVNDLNRINIKPMTDADRVHFAREMHSQLKAYQQSIGVTAAPHQTAPVRQQRQGAPAQRQAAPAQRGNTRGATQQRGATQGRRPPPRQDSGVYADDPGPGGQIQDDDIPF